MAYLRKHTTYNGVRLVRENSSKPWQTECGRFVIRSTGQGGTMARWVVKAIDGSTPFRGYRGKKNASSTELADTLDDAGALLEYLILADT